MPLDQTSVAFTSPLGADDTRLALAKPAKVDDLARFFPECRWMKGEWWTQLDTNGRLVWTFGLLYSDL